jgi:hypothetical protein
MVELRCVVKGLGCCCSVSLILALVLKWNLVVILVGPKRIVLD